ncbi:MAG: hypothetical protein ABL995_09085 [Bryobacteraceae bacterium]
MRIAWFWLAASLATMSGNLCAQAPAEPYKVLRTVKVGGDGGFDYIHADSDVRRLYVARSGQNSRVDVYDLDTFAPVGEIKTANARGVMIDAKSNHGFISSKPLTMFDPKTLQVIKTIDVQGNPDGMFFDAPEQRLYVLSHVAPFVTVVDTKEGSVLGTIDIGGMPEQTVSDGEGHLYINVEDKENIAVVDTKTMGVTAHYDLTGKGGTCAGLAFDAKNRILFAACRNPANMVILRADDGKILSTVPIGAGADGAWFHPATMEVFSSNGGSGTVSVVKENGPTTFALEQTVPTMIGARTSTMDWKTNRLILVAAEFGPPTPPAQPGGNPGRGPLLPDSVTIIVVGK